MSMSQFNKWMRERGVTKGPRGYFVPCVGKVAAATEGEGEMRLRVTFSTRDRDRHGDILEPGGAQLAGFLKNPVVLWAHEYRSLPIGRATAITRDGDALKADVLFAATPFAREVYRLYAKGFLNGWSVGFLPLEWEVIEDEEGKFSGYHVKSWELLEFSATPVPANAEALTEALAKGLVSEPALRKSLETAQADVPLRECGGKGKPVAGAAGGVAEAKPEVSVSDLALLLTPKLLIRLRPCLGDAVGKEIRRRQGKLD